jgi:hypothetical protein
MILRLYALFAASTVLSLRRWVMSNSPFTTLVPLNYSYYTTLKFEFTVNRPSLIMSQSQQTEVESSSRVYSTLSPTTYHLLHLPTAHLPRLSLGKLTASRSFSRLFLRLSPQIPSNASNVSVLAGEASFFYTTGWIPAIRSIGGWRLTIDQITRSLGSRSIVLLRRPGNSSSKWRIRAIGARRVCDTIFEYPYATKKMLMRGLVVTI